MKLTIKEEYEIDQIEQELQNLIKHVYKQKRNKKLYIGLGQTLTCLHAAKYGAIVKQFLSSKAW